jgi:hypothetical protein
MSDEDPKDTDSVTDTREEDVLPAGLIVGQAASDVLDVTRNKRAANEETSASNEVKNSGTTEYFDADTMEDVFPAELIVAQATCDNIDATEMTSTAERELTVCLCPPPSSPGYFPPAFPKNNQVAGSTLAQIRVKARE